MPEPRVVVLLISPLEDVFSVGGEIPVNVLHSYKTLTEKGMKILFVTRQPLEEASVLLSPLDRPALVLNHDEGLTVPNDFEFVLSGRKESSSALSIPTIIDEMRDSGDVVIPIGIGRLPGHAFLNEVELAALLPGSERPDANVSVYQSRADGPDGWSEWTETMMRRIRIILNKSEMRKRNGT